jgi:hypothetical protein
LRQFIDYLLFQVTEGFFTLTLKEIADTATETLLDCVIRISERKLKPPGELPPDGGFARAGEAD